jgi:phospholipase A1
LLCINIFANEEEIKSDTNNHETKEYIKKWEDSSFGLKPHYVNYILPYGFREGKYTSYDTSSGEYDNIEAELQVSLKINIAKHIFGLDEEYYLSYSHRAFWQIYIESSPFRETNYNPEIFILFPLLDNSSIFQLNNLIVGYSHLSNGQGDNGESVSNSRSVDYLYTTLRMEHDALITEFTLWVPFPGNDLNDNPDLMDYVGYGELKFSYFTGKHMFTLKGRGNISTENGAVEATYSYPLIKDVYLYGKIFSGYGESLIDYNNYITKFSIGFSFSR